MTSPRSLALSLLSLSLVAPAVARGRSPLPQDDPSEARLMLETAEAEVAEGNYKKAVQLYEKLAKTFPDTSEGDLARARSAETGFLGWGYLLQNGPSSNRVDVVIMGDGYPLAKQTTFDSDIKSIPKLFERDDVFGEYFRYHNFIRVNLLSKDTQVEQEGREYDTALNSAGIFGEVDRDLVKGYLDQLEEHDGLAIVCVKNVQEGWGEGQVAVIPSRSEGAMFHQWGHVFAGLSEEYVDGTGHGGLAQNVPNVSHTEDEKYVPWSHWLGLGVPGIGVYEGALARVRGAWKPSNKCVMSGAGEYCVVCREAIVLSIYRYVDPIDGCEPPAQPLGAEETLDASGPLSFSVDLVTPATHGLDVRWWVLPEADAPQDPVPTEGMTDRRQRGKLLAITAKPAMEYTTKKKDVAHTHEVDPSGLAGGRYRVVCRVTDPAQGKKDKWPWVLEDEYGLLESERGWWIRVP